MVVGIVGWNAWLVDSSSNWVVCVKPLKDVGFTEVVSSSFCPSIGLVLIIELKKTINSDSWNLLIRSSTWSWTSSPRATYCWSQSPTQTISQELQIQMFSPLDLTLLQVWKLSMMKRMKTGPRLAGRPWQCSLLLSQTRRIQKLFWS